MTKSTKSYDDTSIRVWLMTITITLIMFVVFTIFWLFKYANYFDQLGVRYSWQN